MNLEIYIWSQTLLEDNRTEEKRKTKNKTRKAKLRKERGKKKKKEFVCHLCVDWKHITRKRTMTINDKSTETGLLNNRSKSSPVRGDVTF